MFVVSGNSRGIATEFGIPLEHPGEDSRVIGEANFRNGVRNQEFDPLLKVKMDLHLLGLHFGTQDTHMISKRQ
jgi:hypothetical protein